MPAAAMIESRNPGGRPRKFERGRTNATVRFVPSVYAALREAAVANGRSVSEEVEARVHRSFQDEALIPAINALLAKQNRAGTVLAGWLATELRARGIDEKTALEFGELVKAYFGREQTGG